MQDDPELEAWLARESHYVRLRAAVTGDSLRETINKVTPAIYQEAKSRFPDVDAIGLLAKRAKAEWGSPSLSCREIWTMRTALRLSRQIPGITLVDPPAVRDDDPEYQQ